MEENKNIPEQTPNNVSTEEISAAENIEPEMPGTENITPPQTQTMEVHHAHHPTHKKKWTEYLLEFFMLFLAVFLGFVAENIRENYVERHRELGYIKSMIADLKTDTAKLRINIAQFDTLLSSQDRFITAFNFSDKNNQQTLQKNLSSIMGFPDFIYTDGTIQQLKNSGGFRLIENHDATDSIMAYDAAVKKALIYETWTGTDVQKKN